jgi:UDP-glucose 4-epimerase
MIKKVSLITGVAGTIGSNLAKNLIKKGHYIYGIDNFSSGKVINIKDILKNKKFSLIKCDLSNITNLVKCKKKFKKKIDYVWLLAANSDIKAGVINPNVDFKNTFFATRNSLIFFFNKFKINTRIFFASSSAVYGNKKKKLSEKEKKYFPISNYGESKLLSEIFINDFCKERKLKYIIARFPNVVGKPFTHGIINDLANKMRKNKSLKVLGNGEQQKPFVHVSELVSSIKFLMTKDKVKNLYLLGPNDKGVKVKKIVKLLCEYFNFKKKIYYEKKSYGWNGDVSRYSYEVKKINEAGFKFKLSSSDAIKLAIKEKYDD